MRTEARGHDWGEPTNAWSDDNATCTATRTCTRDSNHTESETAQTEAKVEEDATCTEGGRVVYTASFADGAFATQTKTVATVAQGHVPAPNPRRANVQNPTCAEGGSYDAETYCSVCGETLNTIHVTLAPLDHEWETSVTEPNCTQPGEERHTCKRDGCDASKTHVVPALGHDWGPWVVTKLPAVEERGEEKRTCTRCGEEEARSIESGAPADPFVRHVAAVAPTCSTSGNVEYWIRVSVEEGVIRCTYYGDAGLQDALAADEVVLPALGHDWDEGTETVAPTCTTVGGESSTADARTAASPRPSWSIPWDTSPPPGPSGCCGSQDT